VNRAIVEAHSHGIVTSSTLMANGRAFDDAVQRATSATGLSVGCHVVLVDGSPVLKEIKLPRLWRMKNSTMAALRNPEWIRSAPGQGPNQCGRY